MKNRIIVIISIVGLLVGDLACGLGIWNEWIGLILGMAILTGIMYFFGKNADADPA